MRPRSTKSSEALSSAQQRAATEVSSGDVATAGDGHTGAGETGHFPPRAVLCQGPFDVRVPP